MNERSFRTKVRRYAALERALQRDYSEQVQQLVKMFAASDGNIQDGLLSSAAYAATLDELLLNGFTSRVNLEDTLYELDADLAASDSETTEDV